MKKYIFLLIMIFSLCGCAVPSSFGELVPETENKVIERLNGEIAVHFLDVGQADSIVVELTDKRLMLIDAGEAQSSTKIINYIKNLGYNKIDYVIATHPHADHIGGMADVIKAFDIGTIYMPKVVATSKTYENLLNTISEKGLKIKSGKSGTEVINEENLQAIMVAPNSDKYSGYNDYSIVLKLTYGATTYLFTGDAEEKSEQEITNDITSDVLKVGHHGSDTSSSEEFLAKVNPKYAVISVGANNKYNHPAEVTITKLQKYTKNIYRTDLNGNIIITSDGVEIKVTTEK